jgi:hypothetical protein
MDVSLKEHGAEHGVFTGVANGSFPSLCLPDAVAIAAQITLKSPSDPRISTTILTEFLLRAIWNQGGSDAGSNHKRISRRIAGVNLTE